MGNTSKLRGKAEIKGRNEIIAELYQSREFRETISKMNPANLRDELMQEVMLILCEKDEDEIISIYNSGGLKYYTVRIILNLIQSNTSPFYKKFRSDVFISFEGEVVEVLETLKLDSESELQDRIIDEGVNELKQMEVYNLFWYNRELIKIYLECGNYRDIEAVTDIAFESVYKSIRAGIKKVNEAVSQRIKKPVPYNHNELFEYIKKADSHDAIDKLEHVLQYYQASYSYPFILKVREEIEEKRKLLNIQRQVA